MFINPRMNLFSFQFTRDFMTTEIRNKYFKYLNAVVGSPISEPIDYINYTIQSIDLPGLNYSNVEQTEPYGSKRMFRSSIHEKELFSKELNIEFRQTDGYLNYWIMFDLYRYYYAYSTKQLYLPDQKLDLLDSEGNVVTTVGFGRLLWTGISNLSFNFSSNSPDFLTFTCNFLYNDLELTQAFDSAS